MDPSIWRWRGFQTTLVDRRAFNLGLDGVDLGSKLPLLILANLLVPLVSIVVEIALPLIIVMIVVVTVLSSSTSLSSPIVSLVRLVKSFSFFLVSQSLAFASLDRLIWYSACNALLTQSAAVVGHCQ
ncbi:hypothetical protein TIFTF001_027832 [Ficus carica]|uniref:Uncharacterized protein n=1 Tax=Ficus carica TaxID=3494 RepID=A0AA88J0P7_FICCA|nr:hypothetical protein TIFTF001_027832 [Ficus carica]